MLFPLGLFCRLPGAVSFQSFMKAITFFCMDALPDDTLIKPAAASSSSAAANDDGEIPARSAWI